MVLSKGQTNKPNGGLKINQSSYLNGGKFFAR